MSGYLRQQRRALPPHVAEDTHRLGIGALLHDIGKVGMPDELQTRCILDPESAWPEYRAHSLAGYERVREHVPGAAGNIVLHHHQRFDGRGFPDRVDRVTRAVLRAIGEQIHIFSRIVGLVDAFDNLLHRGGRPVPTIIALHQLRTQFPGWFDPVVVDVLTRLVPPFMVGTIVRLSDEQEAVVVQNHIEHPCRPTVRVLTGSVFQRGARVKGPPLDLRLHRQPFIAAVDDNDVTPYLFDLRASLTAYAMV